MSLAREFRERERKQAGSGTKRRADIWIHARRAFHPGISDTYFVDLDLDCNRRGITKLITDRQTTIRNDELIDLRDLFRRDLTVQVDETIGRAPDEYFCARKLFFDF